jgi:predicted DNA-binding transcriptional regulator AlpA
MRRSLLNNQPGSWYFTRKQVIQITGMSRDTIDRLESRGRFPKRVVLSDRKVGWNVDEVEQWREARNRERFRRASAKESSVSVEESAGET